MLTQCSRDQVVFDLWVVFRDNVAEQLDSLGGTVVPILEKSAPTPFNWSGISTAIQHFTKQKNGFGAVGDFECLRIMESRFAIFVEQPVVIAFDRELLEWLSHGCWSVSIRSGDSDYDDYDSNSLISYRGFHIFTGI